MKPPQHHSQEHEPAIGLTASEYTNSLGLVKFKTFSHRSPNSSAGGSSIPVGDLAGPHGRRVSRGQLNALRHRDSRGQQQVSPTSQGAGETGAMGESGLGWPLEDDDQASPRFELTSTTLPLNNGVIKNHAAFDSQEFTWSKTQTPSTRLKVDEVTISGNYLCLRNASEMYLYHVLTLSVVGPIPIKSHEVFVVYFDMIFVVSNLKLFVYSFSTILRYQHFPVIKDLKFTFPDHHDGALIHFAACAKGVSVTYHRTNYFFSVGKNVVATVSDFFTDEMENVTLDDDGVLTFSCNDKFCFAQLGDFPTILVSGETSNEKITSIIPPNYSGLALVATKNFSLLISMQPREDNCQFSDKYVNSVLPFNIGKHAVLYKDRVLFLHRQRILNVFLSTGLSTFEFCFAAEDEAEVSHMRIDRNHLFVLEKYNLFVWDLENLSMRETNMPIVTQRLDKPSVPDYLFLFRDPRTGAYNIITVDSVTKKKCAIHRKELADRYLRKLQSGSKSRDGTPKKMKESRDLKTPETGYLGDTGILKKHAALLHRARQIMSSVEFENILRLSDSIIVAEKKDSYSRIVYADDVALNTLGCSMEELYGQFLWSLTGPLTKKEDMMKISISMKFGLPVTIDIILHRLIDKKTPMHSIANFIPVSDGDLVIGYILQLLPILDTNSLCPLSRMTSSAVTLWCSSDPVLSRYAHIFCCNDITGYRLIMSDLLFQLTTFGMPRDLIDYLSQKLVNRIEEEKKSQLLQLDYCSNNLIDICERANSLVFQDPKNYCTFTDISFLYQFSTPLASLGRGEEVFNCPYLEYILIDILAPDSSPSGSRRNSPRLSLSRERETMMMTQTTSPAKKRNSTKQQLLLMMVSEEGREREKEKQQMAHLQQQQRELQAQQEKQLQALQQQQQHLQQQREKEQMQQPMAVKNRQMCLVWLGQSGVLLNSYSDCKIIPFSCFYNFSGEYFHWICKGSVRGVDEVAVVSTLRTGSRHIGFNFLCYYFSPKMSFHFEHPYYSADEVPSTEITKKIESYVVQKVNYQTFSMKFSSSKKPNLKISKILLDIEKKNFLQLFHRVTTLHKTTPNQTYADLIYRGQVQDAMFDAFLNSIEVGTKKSIPLIGFESDYCQFVVESEEFPVNSFPLIIFDSSGEFFDLSAFACPETKLIFLVKGDANNTLYCQNYRVFVFLCIDCEHENLDGLSAKLKQVQFLHLDPHNLVYPGKLLKEVLLNLVVSAVNVLCNSRISIHELFGPAIESTLQSIVSECS